MFCLGLTGGLRATNLRPGTSPIGREHPHSRGTTGRSVKLGTVGHRVIEYLVLVVLRPFEAPIVEWPVAVTADARAASCERRRPV